MLELLSVSKELQEHVIPQLVAQLDDLKTVCISSRHLTQLFHSHGINMRYLGYA
jgi:hypothetical protein